MILVWFRKYQQFGGLLLALLLTFVAGWQLGRTMSPYYAAHPIVFQEAAGQPSPNVQAGLQELQHQGQALQAKTSAAPQPTVAAAQQNRPASPSSPLKGVYVGSVNSDLYHDPACSAASRIKEANQVWFASREDAENAGYSPSACTREKLGL